MHASYCELAKSPFNLAPDTSFFYESASHKNGLEHLYDAFDNYQGISAVVGVPGSGKTILVQSFLAGLAGNDVKTATINSSNLLIDDMLRLIADQLNIYPHGDFGDSVQVDLEKYFSEQYHLGNRVVLCIDEAHNLPDETLAVIKNLASHHHNNKYFVLIVLLGHEKLIEKLDEVYYKLESLTEVEVKGYIEYRLFQAGWKGDHPISNEAFRLIYKYSKGIPGFINRLCGKLLLLASIEESHCIDSENVELVVAEIRDEPVRNWLSLENEEDNPAASAAPDKLLFEPTHTDVSSLHQISEKMQLDPTMLVGAEVLYQSEMLLAVVANAHRSHQVKYGDTKVQGLIDKLNNKIEGYKQIDSQQNQADLEVSACSLYDQLTNRPVMRGNVNDNIGAAEYRSILTLAKDRRRSGVVRLVNLLSMCRTIDLANENMKCINLGVLGYSDALEMMFKNISGHDVSFDVSNEDGESVLMWRISISKDMMLYIIGLPINDFVHNEDYAQLMSRLTAATITTSSADMLTAEEEASFLSSLVLCGPKWSQMIGPYSEEAEDKAPFFFQGDPTRLKLDDNESYMPNLISSALFLNEAADRVM